MCLFALNWNLKKTLDSSVLTENLKFRKLQYGFNIVSIYANCHDHNERMQHVLTTTFFPLLKVWNVTYFWWDLSIEI